MSKGELTKSEIKAEFEQATRQVLNDADLATREEVRAVAAKAVDEELEDEAEEGVEPNEDEEHDQENRYTREELRRELPDDIADAVIEHLDAADVAKSMGVKSVDPQLAQRQKELADVHNELQEKAEERRQAAAEAVSTDTPTLDMTVYDGEDGQ